MNVADEAACDGIGGDWQGHAKECIQVVCPVLPGACCPPDGTCQEVADEAACDAIGGVWVVDLTASPPRLAIGSNPIVTSSVAVDAAADASRDRLFVCGAGSLSSSIGGRS